MNEQIDFVVTDYIQRRYVWAAIGTRRGATIEAIERMERVYTAAIMVPVCGKAIQKLGTVGFEPDGFMTQKGSFRFQAVAPLDHVVVSGWLPPQHPGEVTVTIACRDIVVSAPQAPGGMFVLDLPLDVAAGAEDEMRIELSSSFQPSALPGGSKDTRSLGCIFLSIDFR